MGVVVDATKIKLFYDFTTNPKESITQKTYINSKVSNLTNSKNNVCQYYSQEYNKQLDKRTSTLFLEIK